MTVFKAIILGLVQGITEFLPVSSSGHLFILRRLFSANEIPILFDIMLHIATLAAVVVFFRKKIWRLLCVFAKILFFYPARRLRRGSNLDSGGVQTENADGAQAEGAGNTKTERGGGARSDGLSGSRADPSDVLTGTDELSKKTIIAVILTTVLTGAIGIFTKEYVADLSPKFICIGFIVTALLLILSSSAEKRNQAALGKGSEDNDRAACGDMHGEALSGGGAPEDCGAKQNHGKIPQGISWRQALLIGLMQGIGTLPGISRSGSTISGALFSGVGREAAAEFSFIVSIPAILGAFIIEIKDIGKLSSSVGLLPAAAGFVTALVTGYFCLAFLMKIVKKGRLEWFSLYLIPLGIAGLLLF
ncbi:undecaprenyl-diphosphate phosphatase [Treponema parvum]|uniref:undecaprenyl-diphosphate phosphatase n=1 Tax=Treponema parvum TaxID=138851 RepID=UPI001AEC2F74|nr:undecaprenyl-diphosphate phosphatase [Treponema parvum]QTQ17088.1 undecaprenyl-diphosphate phosphatase [Treponema parvum]